MTENEKIIQHNMWNNDDSLFGKFKYTKNCNLLSKFPLPSSVGRKNTSRHTTDHIADLISTTSFHNGDTIRKKKADQRIDNELQKLVSLFSSHIGRPRTTRAVDANTILEEKSRLIFFHKIINFTHKTIHNNSHLHLN